MSSVLENSLELKSSLQKIESPFPSSYSSAKEEKENTEEKVTPSSFFEADSPFPSIYESESLLESESQGIVAPEMEEYVAFLNELYDEEFNDVIAELVDEATELYQSHFENKYGNSNPIAQKQQNTYLLEAHFNPLITAAQAFTEGLTKELEQYDLNTLSEAEIDEVIDRYEPEIEGGIWSKIKKRAKKFFRKVKNKIKGVVRKVKSGVKAVGRGLRRAGKFIKEKILSVLIKLKKLIKPLLKKVLKSALNRLPSQYRPLVDSLRKRFFKKEISEFENFELEDNATEDISDIQREFDEEVANLLFAESEADMDAITARYESETEQPITEDAIDNLDRARAEFINQITNLEDGEDPTPAVENFVPAIMAALRLALRLIGRPRVVNFLAKLLAKLIVKFVGKKYTPLLSQAIVDVGLRLFGLEVSPEDEAKAAGGAVAATVEDTVRQVAALPDYVLDNEELLQGFILEAFEKAAAANLPPVLPESSYEKRPELREAQGIRAAWIMQPLGEQRFRYKKYSHIPQVTITSETARAVRSFCGVPLTIFLRDRLGLTLGRPIIARVHLYEAIPGTMLSQICKYEKRVHGLGTTEARSLLHPLTPEAAGILVGHAGLGRKFSDRYLDHQPLTAVGQRLYYLEIPGIHPKVMATPEGETLTQRESEVSIIFDFPSNQLRTAIFLSEADAQIIAMRLRQKSPLGTIVTFLHSVLEPKLKTVLSGKYSGHVKIISGALPPEYARGPALRLLPQIVIERLTQQINEWLGLFLSSYFKQSSQNFIAASESFADGVTLNVKLNHPPGLLELGRAFRGEPVSLYGFNFSVGMPDAVVNAMAGFNWE